MITSIQALEQKRAKLLADAEKLNVQISEAKQRGTKEQCAILDMLPKRLGLSNLEAVAVMLRARIRGEFGPLAAGVTPRAESGGTRKRLTDEQKTKLDQMCMAKTDAGKWLHTVATIAADVGCAPDTVNKRRYALKQALASEQAKIAATLTPVVPAVA